MIGTAGSITIDNDLCQKTFYWKELCGIYFRDGEGGSKLSLNQYNRNQEIQYILRHTHGVGCPSSVVS